MEENKKILVTGGAGFIGSHLVERLINEGAKVTVIDDFSTGCIENLNPVLSNPNLRIISSKLSECADLGLIVSKSAYVFHLAAAVGVEMVVNSPIRTIETNLRETEVLLKISSQSDVPVMFASTSEVYGKSQKEAFSEMDDLLIGPPQLRRWSYACSKLMDEFLCMAYFQDQGLPVTIIRLFNVVGIRQTGRYGMVLPRFVEAAVSNKPLIVFGTGEQSRCFCDVSDAVEAMLRLQNISGTFGEIYNIGGTEEISILELAQTVITTLDSSSPIQKCPYDKAYHSGFEDMLRRKPEITKLKAATGFTIKTSLIDTIAKIAQSIST